jgi:hypothetical protein
LFSSQIDPTVIDSQKVKCYFPNYGAFSKVV